MDRAELFRLFGAAAGESLSETDSARLEEILAASPEARKLWFLHQDLELGLEEWASARAQQNVVNFPKAPVARMAPRPAAKVGPVVHRSAKRFAAAAVIFVALTATIWSVVAKTRGSKSLATLHRTSMVRWENTRLDQGARILSPQTLDLTSGIIELSMRSGARLVFEGPGRMEILSRNSVRLHNGRIRASVPRAARGFTIEGPGFSAVDHGTEFGCSIPKAGPAELHVFDGSVEFKPGGLPNRWLQRQQALAIRDRGAETIDARPELFISPEDLDRWESDPAALRKAASRMIEKHPDAIVYFDASSAVGSHLPNTAARASGSAFAMHACSLTEGREPGRKAVFFDGSTSRLTLEAAAESPSLTLLAWVQIRDRHRRQDLVSGDGPLLSGEIDWYLYYQNTLGFGALSPVKNQPGRGWNPLHSARLPETSSDWSLLATVIDANSRTVTHFMDGKIVGMGQIPLPRLLRLGPLIIGANQPSRGTNPENRHFHGAIDEFAIIASPLAAEEISRIHSLGRPGGHPPDF
jgi:hypothetical protein